MIPCIRNLLLALAMLGLGACGGSPSGPTDAGDGADGGDGGEDGAGLPDGADADGRIEEEEIVPGPVIELRSDRRSDRSTYLAEGSLTPGPDGSPIQSSTISLNDAEPSPLTLDQNAFLVDLELAAGVNSVAIFAEDEAGIQRRVAFPVFYETGLPSSRELIDAAREAGTLTAEQALAYRVFAAFKDNRLPAEYQGDDSQGYNGDVIEDLVAAVPTLSEAAKDTLGPFLAPLFYQDAPESTRAPDHTRAPKAMPCNPLRTNSCPIAEGWEYVDGTMIRVWYMSVMASSDMKKVRAIIDVLEGSANAALKLTGLMRHSPLSDGGGYFDGGDGRLDIILGDLSVPGLTTPSSALATKQTPVYISLNRSQSIDGLVSNAVHEYMHAIQYSTPLQGAGVSYGYLTMSEASAVWASHYVLSPGNLFHHAANEYLLQNTTSGLLSRATEGLPYGAWLFMLYLEKTISSGIVREMWDAAASKDERSVFIDVLRSHGTLEKIWPKFAVSLWNRDPVKDLRRWDKITEGAQPAGGQPYSAVLGGLGLDRTDAPASLPFLAASYKQIDFPDPTVRSAVVLNGTTYRLGEETPSSIKISGPAIYTADASAVKGAALWAVAEIDGSWREPEDWTRLTGGSGREGYRLYCRERDSEKVEELVLVSSFADTTRPDETYSPPGDKTAIIYTNVFCEEASGQASFTFQEPDATRKRTFSATDFSWERGDEFVLPGSSDGTVVYGWLLDVKGGRAVFDASGDYGACSYSGHGERSISSGSDSMLLAVLPFCTTVPRAYAFTGFADDSMTFEERETCTDPQTGERTETTNEIEAYMEWGFETILIPIFTPQNEWAQKWTVKENGRRLEGDADHLWFNENVTGNWNVDSTKP
ncbi:MAG: hypothetical protein JXR96_06815 [Deltaproteobacteria bacterium]|nr:hypothetical protein [Deltaproteobacteria bacterium]